MAGLSEDVLKKLITPNAKALSSPGGDKYIDEGPVGKADEFDDSMFLAETYDEPMQYKPINNTGGYLTEDMAAKARSLTNYSSNDFNPNRVKSTKMSSAILEDMVKHPIDTAALNPQMIESAGGGSPMNNDRLNQMLARAKQVDARAGELDGKGMPKGRLSESTNLGRMEFDYSQLKNIINECIEEKFNELAKRGLLNEGRTLAGIGLNKGKIKLVDNKGNVFSAKLEYQGNTKDKNRGDQ